MEAVGDIGAGQCVRTGRAANVKAFRQQLIKLHNRAIGKLEVPHTPEAVRLRRIKPVEVNRVALVSYGEQQGAQAQAHHALGDACAKAQRAAARVGDVDHAASSIEHVGIDAGLAYQGGVGAGNEGRGEAGYAVQGHVSGAAVYRRASGGKFIR